MHFDKILLTLGEFGTYQKVLYALICYPQALTAFHLLLGIFTMYLPDFRCAIPGLKNDSYIIKDKHHERLANSSIPWEKDEHGIQRLSKTLLYGTITNTTEKCTTWVYDNTLYQSTALIDFAVPADEAASARGLMDVYIMAGFLVGATLSGIFSDRYGRKKTYLTTVMLMGVSGLAGAWIPFKEAFIVARFFTGVAVAGVIMCGYVLAVELVGPSKRVQVGVAYTISFSVGCVLVPPVAYFIRDWRILQTTVSIPVFACITYFWILPESCRWLLSQGRDIDAEKVLRKAAKVNNVVLPEKLFDFETLDDAAIPILPSLSKYFRNPVLLCQCVIIFYNWMTISMVYYGISLNVGNLGGNLYLNSFIMGVVEIPSLVISIYITNYFGRKPATIFYILLGGLSMAACAFVVIFVDEGTSGWIVVTLAMLGKFGACSAFAVLYVYSSELFPTVIRNIMMGTSSTWARVGGMMAPVFVTVSYSMTGWLAKSFPLIIFGALSIIGALLLLPLPETKGLPLPETVEDAAQQRWATRRSARRTGKDMSQPAQPLVNRC